MGKKMSLIDFGAFMPNAFVSNHNLTLVGNKQFAWEAIMDAKLFYLAIYITFACSQLSRKGTH
ncbi:hypothetical protein [Carboxylicivirga taeanensis]|uniref:hypothetical protein n=1 Tax=Carboxylicivirga taeanensis TaxID=1416875 RepID=UPI003F6E1C1D